MAGRSIPVCRYNDCSRRMILGLHKPSGRRRRNENSAAGGAKRFSGQCFDAGFIDNPTPRQGKFCRFFAPPAPRLARRRRPLSCSAGYEALCRLATLGGCGLLRLLRQPVPVCLRGFGSRLRRLPSQASEPFGFLGRRRTRRAVSPLFVFLLTIKCLMHFVETPKLGVSTDKIKPPSTFIVVETRCIASLRAERNNRMALQPAYNVYNSRTTMAPDVPTKTECAEGRRMSAANEVSSVSKPRPVNPVNPVASIQFLLRKNHSATHIAPGMGAV